MGAGPLFAQQQGNPAPDFEVGLVEGDTFRLSSMEGKVVLVFFFGNTCPSCISAGPNIDASIYQVFKENDAFSAIGIDTWDASSNESTVTAFKNSTGITFPLGLKGGNVAASYQTTYDRLMVIDREGTLVHKGVVVAANDIDNTVMAIQESLETTAIQEVTGKRPLILYPNPARDELHVTSAEGPVSVVTLYDITGKKVLEKDYRSLPSSGQAVLSLEDLAQGIYFYSILMEGGAHSGKLLIQR